MKELNRTDRLTIASLIAAIILFLGFVTLKKPATHFTRTIQESIPLITAAQDFISPEELSLSLERNDNAYALIDLRSPVDYQNDHIKNARNIPVQDILEPDNLDFLKKLLKEEVTVVFYGQDQSDANSAWMILKQMSFDNIKVLLGGFDHYRSCNIEIPTSNEMPAYLSEVPKYNYRAILDSLSGDKASAAGAIIKPEPVKVIKREKRSGAEGGC